MERRAQMRGVSIVTGSIAIAVIGSTALGGVALAARDCPKKHDHHRSANDDGDSAPDSNATMKCMDVGIPDPSRFGGAGEGNGVACAGNANGVGSDAY